ncbi:hypothetical protein [Lactobacillus sp. PV034]|uniref:hypothetical protein n=1 Tax=Lactobacillus sp. PV034 TaxID=2594495 RepID=UPI00223FD9E9|nr:hypothetical protein [Lactobacillus sp. PV034]QNQ80142.1 hypothetical protein FP432_00535 [Lactobacillus sp. PV034]
MKKFLIILGIIAGVALATTASVVSTERIIIEIKKTRAEQAKEKQIREKRQAAKDRVKIALWVVQHMDGPEPIEKLEIGNIVRNGIGGTGGSYVDVRINNSKNNEFSFEEPIGDVIPEDLEEQYSENPTFKYHDKANKKKTLKGVKVEEWKEK